MKNASQLLQFTQACMTLATRQVPPYSSKFSKHTFTQPQLVVLSCLKIKLGVTYRELSDWLAEMPRLRQALGLKRPPHFTTVQKAFQRLGAAVWHVLQRISASLGDGVVAVDSSGWDRSYASRYYTQRIKLRSLKTAGGYLYPDGAGRARDHHAQARHPDWAKARRAEPGAVRDAGGRQGL